MAMVLFYNRINWENYPSVVTPINETNLNKIDYAAKTLDERTVELYNTKADKSVLVNMITDWTLDETTGIITITKGNGTVINFDLNIEKIPVNFEMSEDGVLKMTTEDGSIFTADIGSMIPIIKFKDSDTISVVPEIDGNEKTYSISVKEGSIEDKYIEPNYLANIKIHSQSAELASTQATESAKNAKSYSVGGTGTREGEDTDNAKYYAEKAKEAAENASATASVEIMTTEKAGIGKPDGETITADADGTMRVPSHSDVALNRQTLGYTKKNLLKLDSKSDTASGANYVVNSDTGIVTFNNTASLSGNIYLTVKDKVYLESGKYILTGCPTGGQGDDGTHYMMSINLKNADGSEFTNYVDFGNGSTVTITQDMVDAGVYGNIVVYIFTRCTTENITFYPMLRSADIVDDTFEPYVDDVDTRFKSLGDVSSRTVKTASGYATHLNYPNDNDKIPDMHFMAYWNGAYGDGGASNLAYCNQGAFGTMATKNAADYTPVANLVTTVAGKPLDATMGKTLNDKITSLETKQGGCYLKYENGKFYIGYDDTVMGV